MESDSKTGKQIQRNRMDSKKRILSLLLTFCMVVSLLPVSALTAEAAVSNKYQIGGVYLDDTGLTKAEDGSWEWNGSSKTLTFSKSVNIYNADKNKYTMVAIGLPADSTIVLADGIRVKVTSDAADAIYCEGNLTIKGNGALETYGHYAALSADGTGYSGDDNETGSGIISKGKLTVGSLSEPQTPYLLAAGDIAGDKTNERNIEVGEGLYVYKGFVMTNVDGKVRCDKSKFITLGTDGVIEVYNGGTGVFNDPVQPFGNQYTGDTSVTKLVHLLYEVNGGDQKSLTKNPGVWIKPGAKADLTPTVTKEDAIFQGWSTSPTGTAISDYTVPGDQPGVEIKLYAVYKGIDKEVTPNPGINYQSDPETITGLVPNANYAINGNEVSADGSGNINIANYLGTAIQLVKKSQYGEKYDSAAKEIVLKARPSTPKKGTTFTVTEAVKGVNGDKATIDFQDNTVIYEISTDDEHWTEVTGQTTVDADTPNIQVRVKATATTPRSKPSTPFATEKPQEKSPEVSGTNIDYKNEKLINIPEGIYLVNGVEVTVGADKTIDIKNYIDDTTDRTVPIQKKGGSDTVDSEPANVVIPHRPAAPIENTDYTVVQQLLADGGKATITITDTVNGYEQKNGTNWEKVTGKAIDNIDTATSGATVIIRKEATDNAFASAEKEVTIPKAGRVKEATPSVQVDNEKEVLVGTTGNDLAANADYAIYIENAADPISVKTDANGQIALEGKDQSDAAYDLIGKSITIVKKSTDESVYDDSDKSATVTVPNRATAPTVNKTLKEAGAEITVGAGNAYKVEDDSDWIKPTEDVTVTIPQGKTAQVIKLATDEELASNPTIVTGDAKEATPGDNVKVDYKDSVIEGLDPNEDYRITVNDAPITDPSPATADEEGKVKVDLTNVTSEDTILVVKAGKDINAEDSDPKEIAVADKNAAPTAEDVDVIYPTEIKEDSKATVTIREPKEAGDFDYKDGDTWKTVPEEGIPVDFGGSVDIRTAATKDHPASDPYTVTVKNPEDFGTPAIDYTQDQEAIKDLTPGTYIVKDEEGNLITPEAGTTVGEDGRLPIEDFDYFGETLTLVKKGDDEKGTSDSAPTLLEVKEREQLDPAAFPISISSEGEEATVSGITDAYEYYITPAEDDSADEEEVWIKGNGEPIEVNLGDIVTIRKIATQDTPASEELDLEIAEREDTPEAEIDYDGQGLTGLIEYEAYDVYVVNDNGTKTKIINNSIAGGKDGALAIPNFEAYYGKEIEVVKKGIEENDTIDSLPQKLTINNPALPKEDTPEAKPNYAEDKLTNLTPGEQYIVKVGNGESETKIADENGEIKEEGLSEHPGENITIIKKGDDETTVDSDPQTIAIPERGDAPEGPFDVENAQEGETEATVGGITDKQEYSVDSGDTWTPGTGEDVKVPAGSTVLVRDKATEENPASQAAEIETKAAPVKEATPEAKVNYAEKKLTDLKPDEEYTVKVGDGEPETKKADDNGEIEVPELFDNTGKTIEVVKKGDGDATLDSEPQVINILEKGSAPSADLFDVEIDGSEATITGISDKYEYSTDNGNVWTPGDGNPVKIPVGSEIMIRERATRTKPVSDAVTISIPGTEEGTKTPEATPGAKVDYVAEKLTGLVPNAGYEINVDNMTVSFTTDAAGTTDAAIYFGKNIAITKKGNNTTTTDSAPQLLTVAAKPVAPTEEQFTVVDGGNGNVVIKNITSEYEYSTNDGTTWTPGDGKDIVVPAGTIVLIRRRATETTPASDSVRLVATSYETIASVDQQITSANTDKGDPAGTTFGKLRLKAVGKNKAVKLTWKKVNGATGYIIYGSRCGSKMKKITTVKGASKKTWTQKKLKKGKYYKYIVAAYKTIDGKDYIIAKSKSAHSTTLGGKRGNPTKVTVQKAKVTIKKGKKSTIKASFKSDKKVNIHIAKYRYESSNEKVATVTKKGVIKGKSKGKATIFVYAQNGFYKTVKVTVK